MIQARRELTRNSGVALHRLADPGAPLSGQVRVRMRFASINPADRLAVAGAYLWNADPSVPLGAEGMGVVEAVGAQVEHLRAGDRVILLSRGNWASHRIVDGPAVLPVPAWLTDHQAAILRIKPSTAMRMLDRLAVPAGGWVIQNAAGSSVASWVRRLAARSRVNVIDVARTPTGSALGDDEELADQVRCRTGGIGAQGALDAVGGTASGRLGECLAAGGEMIVFGHLSGQPCTIPTTLLTSRGLRITGFSLRPAEADDSGVDLSRRYASLAVIAAESPEPIGPIFTLEEVERALALDPRTQPSGRGFSTSLHERIIALPKRFGRVPCLH